jgi:hypothetical protein
MGTLFWPRNPCMHRVLHDVLIGQGTMDPSYRPLQRRHPGSTLMTSPFPPSATPPLPTTVQALVPAVGTTSMSEVGWEAVMLQPPPPRSQTPEETRYALVLPHHLAQNLVISSLGRKLRCWSPGRLHL